MKTAHNKISRRAFLLAASAGTAATAAGLAARNAEDSKKKVGDGSQKGYQLTEHVRNYYRTAKI